MGDNDTDFQLSKFKITKENSADLVIIKTEIKEELPADYQTILLDTNEECNVQNSTHQEEHNEKEGDNDNKEIVLTNTKIKEESFDPQPSIEFVNIAQTDDTPECFQEPQDVDIAKFPNISFCENCRVEYENYCSRCVPTDILQVKGSENECNGGVFAAKNIPKGAIFGPYQGLQTASSEKGLAWRIRQGKFVEAEGENRSSWMRHFNCAKREFGRNLIVLQRLKKLYFKSSREINVGEELLVYFEQAEYFVPEIDEGDSEVAFKCSDCYFMFFDKNSLLEHNKECPYKKIIFNCNVCNLRILDEQYFMRHSKWCQKKNNLCITDPDDVTDANKNKFKCNQCDYTANRRSHLNDHVLTHSDEKGIKCIVCEKSFRQRGSLYHHMKTHDLNRRKTFQCPFCSTYYYTKRQLVCHLNEKHLNTIKYKCHSCPYETHRKCTLQRHISAKHSGGGNVVESIADEVFECNKEKPFKCTICKKSFSRNANLNRHIEIHEKDREKKFQCTYCRSSYFSNEKLKSHIKVKHLSNRKYKCSYCTFESHRRDILRKHIVRHSNKERVAN